MVKFHDIDKEKALLSILVKPCPRKPLKIFEKLTPSSFTSYHTRKIFELVKDYYEKYSGSLNPAIAIGLIDERSKTKTRSLKNFVKALAKMVVPWKTFPYLVEELQFFETSREVQKMLLTAKDIFKQNGNPYMVKDFLFDTIAQSQASANSDVEVIDFRKDFLLRLKAIRKLANSEISIRGIRSGIDERFDDETGGYCGGELHIFVAQPSGGKSLCMQDQAVFMAVEDSHKVAFVTNEMSALQTAYRMDARISEIRHKKFRKPTMFTRIDFTKWKLSMKELQKNQVKIIGMRGNCSAANIDRKLEELSFRPEILFVDYINLMNPNHNVMTRDAESSLDWQMQGQILREVKNLALKRNIPIISAGQVRPEASEKEELSFGDIAINKQALSQHADGIYGIVQTRDMRFRNPPRANIQFLKLREGKSREYIEVIPNFSIIRIHDPRKKKLGRPPKHRREE